MKSGFKPALLSIFLLTVTACSNPLSPSSSIESAFNPGFPFSASASSTALSAPTVISGQSVQVTLTIKDDAGESMSNKGLDVSFYLYDGTSTGTFSATIDNGDGTYSSTFTGAADGTATSVRTLINGTLVQAARPTILVMAVPPVGFNYTLSPAVYTRGILIVGNSPIISGGAITAYSISPSLPSGLNFNTTTGVISGTPTLIAAPATFTITASNSGGSTTAALLLTVNDVAPSSLTYSTNPATYTKNVAIASNSPSASGGAITSYAISPALPAGLALSTSTGAISGTPTSITGTSAYTVTASNTGGSTAASLSITVNDVAPNTLAYTGSPYTFTKNTAIASTAPTNGGGVITGCSASPTLPAGLSISAMCVISGTPTTISASASYTVTATNSGGSTATSITVLVNDAAPVIAFASSPFMFTRGTAVTSQTPTNSGGAITGCSSGTALPTGLSLSAACVISGTPTVISAATSYTITASNVSGASSPSIFITVNDIAPMGLTYTSNPATYSLGSAITSNTPATSGGGPVVSYAVSPSLPAGLSLSTSTGVISGTPTANTATASYTVTATNTGGSTTASLTITVNSGPPVLSAVADKIFRSSAITAGGAMTAITFTNTVTGDNSGMSYDCTFDKVVDGTVAAGTACTALPGTATFATASGTFNWTPTTAAWGAYEFKVVGTNAFGSNAKVFVIDIFAGYPITNLVMDFDANYAAVSKTGSNSPMTTTWTNLSSGGVTYDSTLTSFPTTGLTTNGWSGAGTIASPNALTMNASGSRVALGTGINSNAQMMLSTWIAPASIAATKTGSVIATNNENGSGTGFTLKQSDRAVGTIELEALAASASYAYQDEILSIGASNLIGYWRLGEASGTTMVDASGNSNNGNYYVGATLTAPGLAQSGALMGDSNTATKFVATGTGSSSVIWPNGTGPQVFSSEAWFKTTSGYASGGVILGYGNLRTGTSSSYDRKMWMDNTGKISGGIYNAATRVITSTVAYNDGKWHHAVLTYTANDLRLFLDGAQVGQMTASVASAQGYAGYWRIGYDNTNGWSPAPTSPSFGGTIDEVAAYKVVLTPAQVLSHYQIGLRRCVATTVFADGAFKNVSASFDGQYTRVFVNGTQQCSVNYGVGATLAGATGSLTLGATSAGTNSWTGSMSEFRIYSSGTATDVTNIFNATSPRY